MKLTEFIKQLRIIEEEYGDMPVAITVDCIAADEFTINVVDCDDGFYTDIAEAK
jgi:hypothetical protein